MRALLVSILAAVTLAASTAPALAVSAVSLAPSDEGSIYGKSAAYATARATSAACNAAPLTVGQRFSAGRYSVNRSLVSFDLSAVPPGATILYARLDVDVVADGSGTDFAALIFRPAGLALPVCGAANREAAYDSGDGAAFEGTLVETSAPGLLGTHSLTVDHTALAPGAVVTYMLRSSRDIMANAPTGDEWIDAAGGAARLVVVYE